MYYILEVDYELLMKYYFVEVKDRVSL